MLTKRKKQDELSYFGVKFTKMILKEYLGRKNLAQLICVSNKLKQSVKKYQNVIETYKNC